MFQPPTRMNPTPFLVSISILVSIGLVESTHEKSIIKYLGTSYIVRTFWQIGPFFSGIWNLNIYHVMILLTLQQDQASELTN